MPQATDHLNSYQSSQNFFEKDKNIRQPKLGHYLALICETPKDEYIYDNVLKRARQTPEIDDIFYISNNKEDESHGKFIFVRK